VAEAAIQSEDVSDRIAAMKVGCFVFEHWLLLHICHLH